MYLETLETVENITSDAFIKRFLKPQRPVKITNYATSWPAYKKWTFDYFRQHMGEEIVPLYDDRPVSYNEDFNEPHIKMKMTDYIDLLEKEPTNYRIFLYNILKAFPELQNDFRWPDFKLLWVKQMPMLFFGGVQSHVFMHYDIDLANIFHFHFQGTKTCILFPPDQSKYLYKIPYSLITREDIDFSCPDYQKWPALKWARGLKVTLNHGDMLYMPEGYWHFMKYDTAGFSMSLRALPTHPMNFSRALYNLFFLRYFDNFCRKVGGAKWIDYKNHKAISNTHKKCGLQRVSN